MLKAVIVDDEAAARVLIKSLLANYRPNVQIIGEASTVKQGIELLTTLRPDLIFLDIKMPDGTGFDLLNQLEHKNKAKVIFTTAYDEFALKAFQFQAIDYLLKPIDPYQLERAIDKIQDLHDSQFYGERIEQLLEAIQRKEVNKLAVSTGEGWVFLKLDEISHLSSSGGYTTFFSTQGGKHMVARTIKDYEALLPKEQFFRVHQSHIVNLQCVKKVLKEDGAIILMEDETKIPLSRRKKEAFISQMTNQSL